MPLKVEPAPTSGGCESPAVCRQLPRAGLGLGRPHEGPRLAGSRGGVAGARQASGRLVAAPPPALQLFPGARQWRSLGWWRGRRRLPACAVGRSPPRLAVWLGMAVKRRCQRQSPLARRGCLHCPLLPAAPRRCCCCCCRWLPLLHPRPTRVGHRQTGPRVRRLALGARRGGLRPGRSGLAGRSRQRPRRSAPLAQCVPWGPNGRQGTASGRSCRCGTWHCRSSACAGRPAGTQPGTASRPFICQLAAAE